MSMQRFRVGKGRHIFEKTPRLLQERFYFLDAWRCTNNHTVLLVLAAKITGSISKIKIDKDRGEIHPGQIEL